MKVNGRRDRLGVKEETGVPEGWKKELGLGQGTDLEVGWTFPGGSVQAYKERYRAYIEKSQLGLERGGPMKNFL